MIAVPKDVISSFVIPLKLQVSYVLRSECCILCSLQIDKSAPVSIKRFSWHFGLVVFIFI